jgi:hypothetical protein
VIAQLRRRVARLLGRLAVAANPDPALSFTTTKVRDLREEYVDRDMINWMSGQIAGRGIAGRNFTSGHGKDYEY